MEKISYIIVNELNVWVSTGVDETIEELETLKKELKEKDPDIEFTVFFIDFSKKTTF